MRPGTYRALERTAIELCQSNDYRPATLVEYTTYEAGEEFDIPATTNGFFYRIMSSYENKPIGKVQRLGKS